MGSWNWRATLCNHIIILNLDITVVSVYWTSKTQTTIMWTFSPVRVCSVNSILITRWTTRWRSLLSSRQQKIITRWKVRTVFRFLLPTWICMSLMSVIAALCNFENFAAVLIMIQVYHWYACFNVSRKWTWCIRMREFMLEKFMLWTMNFIDVNRAWI